MIKNSQTPEASATDCPYALGGFCARAPRTLARELCACCQLKRFAAGSVIEHGDWRETFSLLADGFLVSREASESADDAFSPLEPVGGGSILTLPEAWFAQSARPTVSFVIKPCVIARFDARGIERLRRQSLPFAWAVAESLRIKYQQAAAALEHIGGKDARRAVKYILDFSEKYGVGYLTHAQIALVTGLARPTVTRTMRELMLDDGLRETLK